MSISFMWSLPSKGKSIEYGVSSDRACLEGVFGSLPRTFTHADYERLSAMAAMMEGDSLYSEIASLICLNDEITVWCEY